MKRIALILPLLLLFTGLAAAAESVNESVLIDVYLYEEGGCAGRHCHDDITADELYNRYSSLFAGSGVQLKLHNLSKDASDAAALESCMHSAGVDYRSAPLPLAVINGCLFAADGTMDEAIRDYVEQASYAGYLSILAALEQDEPDEETVVYFYSAADPLCRRIGTWLQESLPQGFRLCALEVHTSVGNSLQKAYAEEFGISVDALSAPAVVLRGEVFQGKNSIFLSVLSRAQLPPRQQEYADLVAPLRTQEEAEASIDQDPGYDLLIQQDILFSKPFFLLTPASGNAISPSSFHDEPFVLYFWNSWCPYCETYMQAHMADLLAQAEADGIKLLLVSREGRNDETLEKAVHGLEELGLPTEKLVMDGQAALFRASGLHYIPSFAFFAADGTLCALTQEELTLDQFRALSIGAQAE